MNLQKIYLETIENGGLTYNLETGETNPKTGYMAGGFAPSDKFPKWQFANGNRLRDFIRTNIEFLLHSDTYLGTWIDNDTVFLDISANFKILEEAFEHAKINREIAIWDCENERNLYIDDKMSFEEFKKSLKHFEKHIEIPCLNKCINKIQFVTANGFDFEAQNKSIYNAYKYYLSYQTN